MTDRATDQVGVNLGAEMARRFRGNAVQMADVCRLVLRTDDIGERSLFYIPPRAHGQHGVAVMPPVEDEAVRDSMIAVAVALHLDGSLLPMLYINGEYEATRRTTGAHAFARGFMEQREQLLQRWQAG